MELWESHSQSYLIVILISIFNEGKMHSKDHIKLDVYFDEKIVDPEE